jgi:hypothetical protein
VSRGIGTRVATHAALALVLMIAFHYAAKYEGEMLTDDPVTDTVMPR